MYADSYGRRDYDRGYGHRDRDRYPNRELDHAPRGREWDMDRNGDYRDDGWDRRREDHRERERAWRGGPPHPMDRDRDYPRGSDRDHGEHEYRNDRYSDRNAEWHGHGEPRGSGGRKRDYEPDDRGRHPDPPGRQTSRSDDPDWKRRKIDQDEVASYDNPPQGDYEFDDEGYETNQGHRRRQAPPSEPSQHVIFLGLDPDFTEADLHSYLSANGGVIESVTIIRDRSTGRSRCFGFAQFASIQNASEFVYHHYPFVALPPPSSHITRAIPPAAGRNVKIDFSQSAQPQGDGARRRLELGSGNDGTRDIGGSPSQVILLRLLDRNTTIDEIAFALRGAEGSGKESAVGMKRIMLIIDRVSRVSLGFAFVEFEEVEDAKALLGAALSPTLHPSGFFVSSRPVAISFALPYVFQLLPAKMEKDEWCVSSSMAIGNAENGWTRYWDETAGIEEKTFEVPPRKKLLPAEKQPQEVNGKVKDKKGKDKQNGSTIEITIHKQPAAQPTVLQKTAGPLSLKLKPVKATEVESAAKPSAAFGFANDDAADTPIEEVAPEKTQSQAMSSVALPAKSVAPLVESKKVADNIRKWKQAQEEPSPSDAVPPEAPASVTEASTKSAASATTSAPSAKSAKGQSDAPEHFPGDPGFEFGDPIALTCLLCLRQLKSFNQLQRHNAESDLHKKNLKDTKLCEVAKEKVAAARRQQEAAHKVSNDARSPSPAAAGASNAESSDQQPKYRDRAQERRQALNQPETVRSVRVMAPAKRSTGGKALQRAPSPPAATPLPPAQDKSNVGNKLLSKMGWTEGAGLGAESEGRVEPVKTTVYTSGAGLGAAKAREVTNFTNTSYADMGKEAARERYG